MKMNCWDYMNCGRELGGSKEKLLGNCPAATYIAFRGTNGGFHSGRYCWYVAGTFSQGKPKCIYLSDMVDCSACDFFELVKEEEGPDFKI